MPGRSPAQSTAHEDFTRLNLEDPCWGTDYGSATAREKFAVLELHSVTVRSVLHALRAWRPILAICALLLAAGLLISRLSSLGSAAVCALTGGSASPAPAPSAPAMAGPRCADYQYPQCERAMSVHLDGAVRSRCAAFEAVKAEGDNFRFPWSDANEERCGAAGCCGCPGQCSRCPPILPECASWRFDGTWSVAFDDGTSSRYIFDALGHCEAEFPVSVLPVNFKYYNHAFIPSGSDLPGAAVPSVLTLDAAKTACANDTRCSGLTYNEAESANGALKVFFKTTAALSLAPGTGWQAFVREGHPTLQHDNVAVAGPLVAESNVTAHHGHFIFDLHRASPQFFPSGSKEHIAVDDGELRVARFIPGNAAVSGTGVLAR